MNLGLREDLFNFPESIMSVVPVAPRVAFSGMGQARIENNLFIYLFIMFITEWTHSEISFHIQIRKCVEA